MMSKKTKFTIVIPTRERADVLKHTLANVVSQEYDNFDILVSDNASADNTREVVDCFAKTHNNIRYINTNERKSMSHNWEFALKHVEDGWVTFLGDDDGLLPGALDYVDKIIKESGVAAVASTACGFSWPNIPKNQAGCLTMVLNDGFLVVQSDEALRKVINGDAAYSSLPMMYQTGFIDTALIKEAKVATGKFFLSMIPDVYSAIVFTLLTKKFAFSCRPLAICGHSSHSGGAASFSNQERNEKYSPAQKFFSEENIPFHNEIPLLEDGTIVRSIQAIVYESYLQAKAFHHHKEFKTSHEKQLFLILRDASPDFSQMINDWSKVFADRHHLDLNSIKAQLNSIHTKFYLLLRRLKGYWFYIRYIMKIPNEPNLPIRTVFDAGLVAATLLNIKPSWAFRISLIAHKARQRFL